MCTSGCAPTSTCIHTWTGTHRFTRAHAHTESHIRCVGGMQVYTHTRLPCRLRTHTPHARASHSQACAGTIPMWVCTASRVHAWVSPSTYVGCRTLLRSPRKMPVATPGHCPAHTPDRRLLLLLLSRFSRVRLCATPETAAHQAPPSLGFSKQEHWSGLPFPSPMQESEK